MHGVLAWACAWLRCARAVVFRWQPATIHLTGSQVDCEPCGCVFLCCREGEEIWQPCCCDPTAIPAHSTSGCQQKVAKLWCLLKQLSKQKPIMLLEDAFCGRIFEPTPSICCSGEADMSASPLACWI